MSSEEKSSEAKSWKQTLADVAIATALFLERGLRPLRSYPELNAAQSILVLEYVLPLGCCVHLTPLYEAIRAARPDATITVATRGIGLAVLRHNPSIDHLIETPDPLGNLLPAARTLASELKRLNLRPDSVMTGASDQRTRIGLLAMFATGGRRVGFTQTPALYQMALEVDRSTSLIANNLRLAELVGCGHSLREPRVYFSPADVNHANALFQEAESQQAESDGAKSQPAETPDRPRIVLVTQTSGGQRTGWYRERFVRVIEQVRRELLGTILFVGTASDSAAIEEIRSAAGGTGVSLAGRTSVTQLAAVLAMSDLVLTLDTGTMHITRAVGTPMVVLAPSWQKPIEWLPLGQPHVRILRGADRDAIPANYQLDEIEAEDVLQAIADLTSGRVSMRAMQSGRSERVRNSLSITDHMAR